MVREWLRFYLIFTQVIKNINLPKVYGPRSQTWPKFCLISTQVIRNINLPKQVIKMTHNSNKNMADLPFINNNTFAGYLHSKGVVQHFHPNLLGSMHLFQLSRWYDIALPNWTLTFPMLGFLLYLQPFSRVTGLNFILKSEKRGPWIYFF